jgi:hypothetical protein
LWLTTASVKRQRHQRRPGVGHLEAELARQRIGKAGGAHLGDGLSARGHHDAFGGDEAVAHENLETFRDLFDRTDGAPGPDRRPGCAQALDQHIDDLGGRAIAEQLPEGLLMVGNAAALDPLDEHFGCEPRQRRERKARVLREEALAAQHMGGVHIGEIAAPAARNTDLFAGIAGVIDDENPPSALPGLDACHQAGRTGPQNYYVKIGHFRS